MVNRTKSRNGNSGGSRISVRRNGANPKCVGVGVGGGGVPAYYRSGTVNSKSFIGKVLLRIKWKFELTVHFKHGILGKL